MTETNALSIDELVTGFLNLGIKKGDHLIVHSSMRALGPVDGGADTVINALLKIIGSNGNLMFPTFNYSYPFPVPYFEVARTPGRTGILNEMARKYPKAVRSVHPTHSVAVIGPNAEKLTADHMLFRAFGVGSPIDRLARMGGKVLLLGVSHVANSHIHIGEEYAQIPKVSRYDVLPENRVLMPDGRIILHQLDTSASCSAAFDAVELPLRQNGEILDGRISSCLCRIMSGQSLIMRVISMIQNQADILLCNWEKCRPCSGTRQMLREAGMLGEKKSEARVRPK